MHYILILITVFFWFACKDKIQVDVQNKQSLIVIEGLLTNQSTQYIDLQQSGDFYQLDAYNTITDATVQLIDTSGQILPLVHNQNGRYELKNWTAQVNQNYQLLVEYQDKEYRASAQLPPKVEIRKVDVKIENDSSAYVRCKFKDPATTGDFYRLRFYRNGKIQENRLYTLQDSNFNGKNRTYNFKREAIAYGDTIVVELWHISEPTYDYYKELEDVIQQGLLSSVPYNPPNNIRGAEALGFWGAAAIDRDTLILKL